MNRALSILTTALALAACQPEQSQTAATTAAPAGAADGGLAVAPAAADLPDEVTLRLSLQEGEAWGEEMTMEMSFMGFLDWEATSGIAYQVVGREGDEAAVEMSTEWMRIETTAGAMFGGEPGDTFVMDTRDPDSPDLGDLFFGGKDEMYGHDMAGEHSEHAGMTEEEIAAMHDEHHEEGEGHHAAGDEDHAHPDGHHAEESELNADPEGHHDKGTEPPDEDYGHGGMMPGFEGFGDLEEMMDFEGFLGVPMTMRVNVLRQLEGMEAGQLLEEWPEWHPFNPSSFMENMPVGWSFGQDMLTFPEGPVRLGETWTSAAEMDWSGAELTETIPEGMEGGDEAVEALSGMGMSMAYDLEHEAVGWWEGMLRISTTGTLEMVTDLGGDLGPGGAMGQDSFTVWADVAGETLWHPDGYVSGYEMTWTWRFMPEEAMGESDDFAQGMLGSMMGSMHMSFEMRRMAPGEWTPVAAPAPEEG